VEDLEEKGHENSPDQNMSVVKKPNITGGHEVQIASCNADIGDNRI
jgi:hypothetical protein